MDPELLDPPVDPLRSYRIAVFAYREAFLAGRGTAAEREAMGKAYRALAREEQLKADTFWEKAQKSWK
jgi:hypothetical protein